MHKGVTFIKAILVMIWTVLLLRIEIFSYLYITSLVIHCIQETLDFFFEVNHKYDLLDRNNSKSVLLFLLILFLVKFFVL